MPKVSVITLPTEAIPVCDILEQQSAESRKRTVRRPIRWQAFFNGIRRITADLASTNFILVGALAFLLSRVSIMGELSPYGLAFFAALARNGSSQWLAGALGAFWGVLSGGNYAEAGLYALVMLLFLRFSRQLSRLQNRVWVTPLFLFAVISLGGMVIALWRQQALYNMLLAVLDGALCMVLTGIFLYGTPLFTGNKQHRFTNETYLCAMVVLALAVAGIGDFSLWNYSLRNILGSLLIVLLALTGGAGMGAVAGIVVGLVIGLNEGQATMTIAFYALAGTLAGVFRILGKYAVATGFVLGSAIVVMYTGYDSNHLRTVAETAVAAAAALLAPATRMTMWREQQMDSCVPQSQPVEQLVKPAVEKLNHLSAMFHDLSGAFEHMSDGDKAKVKEEEINQLLAAVGKQVCGDCQKREVCWEKEFYKTYQMMLDSFALAEAGSLTVRTLTPSLRDSCLAGGKLIETINMVAEKNRTNQYWQKKMGDVRQMITEQLKATGIILGNLSQEISKEPPGDKDLAELLKNRCAIVECPVSRVQTSTGPGGVVIEITKQPCQGVKECIHTILPLAAGLVQEKMLLEAQCGQARNNKQCRLILQSAQRFHIETAVASAAKDLISGDSCSIASLNQGKIALMISDGMGSGQVAAAESAMTVKFLERLLAAGFDVDVAVKTVNSMLMLRTREETFATVDMTIIDTYSGSTEFLKIGSAPSFVKRVREVSTIQSASLPIGILHQIEIEPVRAALVGGDIIVMVSDGIADALPRGIEKENWIANYLRRLNSVNPQDIADKLLKQAHDLAGDSRRDDMTVVVARLVEKPALVQ